MDQPIHPPIFITQNNSFDKLSDSIRFKLSGIPVKHRCGEYKLCLIHMVQIKITIIFDINESLLDKFYYSKWCRIMDNRNLFNKSIELEIKNIDDEIIYPQLIPSYIVDSLSYLHNIKDFEFRVDIEIHFSQPNQLFICLNDEKINLGDMKFEVIIMDSNIGNYVFEILI